MNTANAIEKNSPPTNAFSSGFHADQRQDQDCDEQDYDQQLVAAADRPILPNQQQPADQQQANHRMRNEYLGDEQSNKQQNCDHEQQHEAVFYRDWRAAGGQQYAYEHRHDESARPAADKRD
jgi:hypothetical protein